MKSFAPVVLPLAALIAALVRWWLQGSGNVYTAHDKRLYVPDPDLGWRIADHHPIWLGLEVCAVLAAIAAGVAIGGFIRRMAGKRPALAKALLVAAWGVGGLTLAVPIAAFASGGGIEGARDTLPDTRAQDAALGGISGSLELPRGRYDVVAHQGTSITARVTAGGEAFDARFSSDIRGSFVADPRDLRAQVTGEASVAAASVDTGVRPRSNSARDEYLQAATYPQITFALDKLLAARAEAPNRIAFRATGQLDRPAPRATRARAGRVRPGMLNRLRANRSTSGRVCATAPDGCMQRELQDVRGIRPERPATGTHPAANRSPPESGLVRLILGPTSSRSAGCSWDCSSSRSGCRSISRSSSTNSGSSVLVWSR